MANRAHAPQPPHIVALPVPFFGHITPMMQLCKVLASHGLTITFVNTQHNHRQIAPDQAGGQPSSPLQHRLDIRMTSIPDGLPPDYVFRLEDASKTAQLVEDLRWAFETLMENLTPRPTCIITDGFIGWTQDVAHKFSIPRFALWTSSAAECAIQYNISTLISTGQLPVKRSIESSEQQKRVIAGITGLPPFYLEEISSFLQVEDLEDPMFNFFKRQCGRLNEADGVLVNSFPELEGPLIDALGAELKIQAIGPLLLSPFVVEGSTTSHRQYSSPVPVRKNDEEKCLQWLNAQAPSSVLYVAFGSGFVNLPAAQIEELVLGLEASEHRFLLVFRIDYLNELDITPLFQRFLDRSGDTFLVVGWAPQQIVLAHASVGGFLTHCGWNSVVESIANGIPMLCWPVAADQALNCRYVVDEWKIGMMLERGEEVIGREEVKLKVKAMMEIAAAATTTTTATDDAAAEDPSIRTRVRKLRDAAIAAAMAGGVSHHNLLLFSRGLLG